MIVWLILLFIFPILGTLSFLAAFPWVREKKASLLASFWGMGTLVAVIGLIVTSYGKLPSFFLFGQMPWIETDVKLFGFIVDPLSLLMLVVTVVIGFLVIVFSGDYLTSENREHPTTSGWDRYYAWLLLFIFSMVGVALSPNLLQFLIFWEMTTICSAALISFHEDEKSCRAGFKALVMTHVPGLFFLVALALVFVYTGNFEFASIGRLTPTIKTTVVIFFLLASWAKSAQGPFYTWIPDAMEAPTPISAYLHAAAMVNAGAFLMARVLTAGFEIGSGVGLLIAIMAIVTMYIGLFFYFFQDDLKRLLAYSTIVNVGYIFLGLSLGVMGSVVGMRGGLLHLICHAFAKTILFLSVGAISYATGTRAISRLSGLYRGSPFLAVAFTIGVLSVTGIPPFACFWSKFFLIVGAFELKSVFGIILGVLILGESVGAFIWFIIVTQRVFFGKETEANATLQVPRVFKFVLGVLIILTLAAPLFGMRLLEGVK